MHGDLHAWSSICMEFHMHGVLHKVLHKWSSACMELDSNSESCSHHVHRFCIHGLTQAGAAKDPILISRRRP